MLLPNKGIPGFEGAFYSSTGRQLPGPANVRRWLGALTCDVLWYVVLWCVNEGQGLSELRLRLAAVTQVAGVAATMLLAAVSAAAMRQGD